MKKRLVISTIAMLIIAFTLSAQQPMKSKRQQMPQKMELKVFKKQQTIITPQMRADKMAEQLGLSDAEKAKLKVLFEKQDANRIKLIDEVQKQRKEMKAKFENEKKSMDAEFEKVIGKEKMEKMNAKKDELKKKMIQNVKGRMNNKQQPCPHEK